MQDSLTIPSPFKFLDAFEQADTAHFYGREPETKALVKAFRKSSLVVLYGPSGAGKSSLINCGLVSKLKLQKTQIIEVRRGKVSYVHALQEKLFPANNFNFVNAVKDIYEAKVEINESNKSLNNKSDELNRLLDNNRRGHIDRSAYQIYLGKFVEDKEALETHINQKIEQIASLETDIKEAIVSEATLNHPSYLILDQFEELFVLGSEVELSQIGILLALVKRAGLPIKILISIREEFLGKLSFLENEIPYLYQFKTNIDHPDEKTIRIILKNSFEAFNINQSFTDESFEMEKKEPIPEEDQYARIDKIMEQLTETGGLSSQFHFGTREFFLPFLQIYLDRLYKEDFARTYHNKRKHIVAKSTDPPCIEFSVEEISQFGTISEVLKEYIGGIYNSILDGADQETIKNLERSSSPVIKLLRHFSTPFQTKKPDIGVISEGDQIYISDKELEREIQLSLFDEYNPSRYRHTVSYLLKSLRQHRLIKINEDTAELSHDILSVVVNTLPVEEHIWEILKRAFDNSFHLYQSEIKRGMKPTYLQQDILRKIPEEDLPRIITKGSVDYSDKVFFYQKSKDWYGRKERKRKLIYTALIGTLFTTSLALLFLNARLKLVGNEIQKRENDNQISSKIFENVGDAFHSAISDLTAAYDSIKTLEKDTLYTHFIEREKGNNENNKFKIREIFTRELENNFYIRPFYRTNIRIPSGEHILAMKHLVTSESTDTLFLFAKTPTSLFIRQVDLGNDSILTQGRIATGNISSFEPYITSDDSVKIIYSNENGLYEAKLRLGSHVSNPLSKVDISHNLTDLNSISKNFWVGIWTDPEGGGHKLIGIDTDSGKLRMLSLDALFDQDSLVKIYRVERLKDNEFCMLALVEKDITDYLTQELRYVFKFEISSSGDVLNPTCLPIYTLNLTRIKDFKVVDEHVLIADRNTVYNFESDLISLPIGSDEVPDSLPSDPQIVSAHNGEIRCIDYWDDYFLLGSADKTVSMYVDPTRDMPYDEIKIKELIGHTDAILNVSFVKTLQNDTLTYILTSGQDGTIKVWDIRPIYELEHPLEDAREIKKLKIHDDRLYVAFQFDSKPKGFLYSLDHNLGSITKHYQYLNRSSNKGNVTCLDFYQDNLLMGSENWLITSSTSSTSDFWFSPERKDIRDVKIKGNDMFIAAAKGLVVYKNLDSDSIRTKAEQISFNSIDVHPKEEWVLSTSDNGNIYLWDLATDSLHTISGHTDRVKDACYSANGEYFVSGSWDNTAIVWERNRVATSEPPYYQVAENGVLKVHTSDISDVDIFENKWIATASSDNSVQIHQLLNEEGELTLERQLSLIRHKYSVRKVTFGVKDSVIYSGDKKGYIRKWNWRSFKNTINERRKKYASE